MNQIHVFSSLRPFLGEQKSELLLISVLMLNFSLCPLILLLFSKGENNILTRTHKSAIKALYSEYGSTFEELLDKEKSNITRKKNLQILIAEIYNTINHLNSEYWWKFFTKGYLTYYVVMNYARSLP